MDKLIIEMMMALNCRAYYPALITAMTIPDVCASLDTDGHASPEKYAKWYDEYVTNQPLSVFDGNLAYYVRCAILRQGRLSHPQFKKQGKIFKDVAFVVRNAKDNTIHRVVLMNDTDSVYTVDLKMYCDMIYAAVKKWLAVVENTKTYQNNMQKYFSQNEDMFMGCIFITSAKNI